MILLGIISCIIKTLRRLRLHKARTEKYREINMDAGYNAFNVKERDKLYKKLEGRIRIW